MATISDKLKVRLIRDLSRDEGRKSHLYKCTAGKWTIGVGRNIQDNGLSQDEIDYLLQNDMRRAWDIAQIIFGNAFATFSEGRQAALLNMIFNLGQTKFSKFRAMITAVKKGEWQQAADEALDSTWAVQVGDRALRIAELLRHG